MRKTILVSLVLSSFSLFADDRWRISILAAEISTSTPTFAGQSVDDPHPGVALGIAYVPTPQWDIELTVATQRHRSPYTRLFGTTNTTGPVMFYPATEFRDYRVNPVDVSVTRHFLTGRTISPYVRAGVRYVNAPNDPAPFVISAFIPGSNVNIVEIPLGYGFDDRVSAQAGAGMRVRLTPRTAFRAEATRLLRSEEVDFDPLMRYAVGLSWVF